MLKRTTNGPNILGFCVTAGVILSAMAPAYAADVDLQALLDRPRRS